MGRETLLRFRNGSRTEKETHQFHRNQTRWNNVARLNEEFNRQKRRSTRFDEFWIHSHAQREASCANSDLHLSAELHSDHLRLSP